MIEGPEYLLLHTMQDGRPVGRNQPLLPDGIEFTVFSYVDCLCPEVLFGK